MNGDPFLRPIDGAQPSGVELRHVPEFLTIETLLEPAARKNRMDSNGVLKPYSGVDWAKVLSDAERLAATGRDLRLLVIVARAWTNQAGFGGLAAGLELISDALEGHWDSIHPELRDRPDKAMAAKGREGAIRDLENRDDGILGDLEMRVMFEPRGLGPVWGGELAQSSLSDFEYMQVGTGGMSSAEKAEHSANHATLRKRISTAIIATHEEDPTLIEGLVGEIDAAERARAALEAGYAKAGGFENGGGCRLNDLKTFLARSRKALDEASADVASGSSETAAAPIGGELMPMETGSATNGGGIPARIETRREVEKCLDMIVEFYERTEPSSPIPHLAQRLRRMVPMDFMQLIEEVAPSGLKDFKNIAGVDDKKRND
ncbi:type VI secretion system ImpA family N-terminal domain-containing protein [Rhodobacteraceae bacterium]|nr:type VI secretion system ImpA family N-terminal domain-containing protein [Paracoccaceae bacterium]